MTDLRNYIGKTAKVGQKIDFYYVLGGAGEGKLTEVSPSKVGIDGHVEIKGIVSAPVKASIELTGPKTCTVKVNSAEDTQATYKEVSHLQVECKLFGQKVRIDLWQDGLYSNVRVFWGLLVVHTWAHPQAGELVEGEDVSLAFNPALWPALPAGGAPASL